MKSLRVGLIGCGRLAQQAHLPNLRRLTNVELVAFADPEAERRRKSARLAPEAMAFKSYEELLETDVEAVVICLPNTLHGVASIAALERGKHVYLEKPLATRPDEGLAVIKAWQRAGVVGMMGFNYRLNKLYASVRDRLRSGVLGKPLFARSVFSTAPKDLPGWKMSVQSGGGVLFDLASHHLDLVRYFFDQEVSVVFADTWSQRSEGDTAMLQMLLADGMSIQSFFSTSAVEEDSFEIYGEQGKLSVNRYLSLDVRITQAKLEGFRLHQLRHGLRSLARASHLFDKARSPAQEPSYRTAMLRFVEAVRNSSSNSSSGEHPTPDFFDGYHNLNTIEAAERSAKTGRRVQITKSSVQSA
jgi:UDP-N-acetylglucosamine 3-dehydrogenase